MRRFIVLAPQWAQDSAREFCPRFCTQKAAGSGNFALLAYIAAQGHEVDKDALIKRAVAPMDALRLGIMRYYRGLADYLRQSAIQDA
jgi:hypothetical protein